MNKSIRYLLAILACAAIIIIHLGISIYLGWKSLGGALPVMLSYSIVWYTWRTINGQKTFTWANRHKYVRELKRRNWEWLKKFWSFKWVKRHFLKNKYFYLHLSLATTTLVLLFIGWLKYLDYYTQHDKYIQVPDFNNLPISALDSFVEANDIRYVIIDSIFDDKKAKGIVVTQEPAALTDVKQNRRIYLTINSLKSRKVEFPDIYDLSLRQAIRELENTGLLVGKLDYRADIATNKVLDYKINGIKIEIGQVLYYGTIVDLVIGKGLGNQTVIVPNLVGLTRVEANIVLKSTSLNIGSEIFKSSVNDSSSAVIYKQIPIGNDDNTLNIGSVIDLFFQKIKSAGL